MKVISILGAGSMYSVLASMLADKGVMPLHPKQIKRNPRGWQHQDLTNTASQPAKSSYNAKQRKKKAKRKSEKANENTKNT